MVLRSWATFTRYLLWSRAPGAILHAIYVGLAPLGPFYWRNLHWSRALGQHLHAIYVGLALLGPFYTLDRVVFFSQVVVLSPCLDSGRFFGPDIATRKPSDRTPTHHDIEHSCSLLSYPPNSP